MSALSVRQYAESRFEVRQGTTEAFAPTGETYTELCQLRLPSLEEAVRQAKEHFERYAATRKGFLYWRIEPEIEKNPKNDTWGYYMRLLISEKPIDRRKKTA